MRRNELIELRQKVNDEIDKRNRINQLSENELIKEYLKIKGLEKEQLDSNNIREILKQILNDFKVTKTNGIYVCTSSYYIDCHISYQDTEYYTVDVDIDSKYAEKKIYKDIESGQIVRGSIEKDNYSQFIPEFEKNNIVLNPNNKGTNQNGYQDVRLDFFENSLNKGQSKSKRLILSKYPRI